MIKNKNYIAYIAGYGPTPSNINAFDDHIEKNIKKNNIANPISLPNKYENEILSLVNDLDHGVILVSGTAGDGKTYLCRQIWTKLGFCKDQWNSSGNYLDACYNNKRLIFIKDLSAVVADSEAEEKLMKLISTSAKSNNSTILIIATNDGQILSKFRNYTKVNQNDQDILELLESEFFEYSSLSKTDEIKIIVKDLRDICNSEYIEKAISEVTSTERWYLCENCECYGNCPIAENAKRLGADKIFKDRLIDVLEILLAQGYHITTRNLFLLISNIILGYNSDAYSRKQLLLSCAQVKKHIEENKPINSSIYLNALGLNLEDTIRHTLGIFKEISTLKLGQETSKIIDVFISSDPKEDNAESATLRQELTNYHNGVPVFIKDQFQRAKKQYLHRGPLNEDDGEVLNNYKQALINCRCCLFFNLESSKLFNLWDLSIYKNGGKYLDLLKTCRTSPTENHIKTETKILIGLNKIFTGYYTNESRSLYITTSGGYSNTKVCSIYLSTVETSRRNIYILINLSNNRLRLPQITIKQKNDEFNPISFILTPLRYEFLTNVANGYIPSSFSSECFDDLMAFKAIIVSSIEKYNSDDDSESGYDTEFELIRIGENGNISR